MQAGYSVHLGHAAALPLEEFDDRKPVAFLLEFGPGQGDRLVLCRRLRSHPAFSSAAIIFLCLRAEESDRISGLEAGADAYLAGPFAARELVTTLKAVLRSYARRSEGERLSVGEIEIDLAAMSVKVAGQPVALSMTEFRLLEFLSRSVGRAVTRDQLLQVVSSNPRIGKRAIDVYVRRLRKKLEREPAQPRYLKTMRGVGYRLDIGARSR
jgi:two-component system phosphate regulon response regulator PhoB